VIYRLLIVYVIAIVIAIRFVLIIDNTFIIMFANKFGNQENVCCGLIRLIPKQEDWEPPTKCPIPLISVDVNASIVHAVAQVEVTQVYVNKEEQPIEAIYYFPVNPDGAVTHFQAELEGRIIKVS